MPERLFSTKLIKYFVKFWLNQKELLPLQSQSALKKSFKELERMRLHIVAHSSIG